MTSLLVFISRSLRHQSWSVYLASLAVSDTGFLVCLFFSWCDNIGLNVYHRHGWCQALVYMTYICCFLSVWYIVCFTAERYIVVKCPLKRLQICTTKRAKIIVISFALFSAIFYSFATWTSALRPMYGRHEFCMPKDAYMDLLTILSYIDTAITLIIPTVVILLLNTLIIYAVAYYHRQRDTMTGSEAIHLQVTDSDDQGANRQKTEQSYLRAHGKQSCPRSPSSQVLTTNAQRTLTHMNRMLIIVSMSFVLLNLPSHTIRIYTFFMALHNAQYQASHWLVSCQKLFQYVYYLNFSINFVLYSACGSHFRHAMIHLFKQTTLWSPCNWLRCNKSSSTNCKETRFMSMTSKTNV